jgi:hypothetical protein
LLSQQQAEEAQAEEALAEERAAMMATDQNRCQYIVLQEYTDIVRWCALAYPVPQRPRKAPTELNPLSQLATSLAPRTPISQMMDGKLVLSQSIDCRDEVVG